MWIPMKSHTEGTTIPIYRISYDTGLSQSSKNLKSFKLAPKGV